MFSRRFQRNKVMRDLTRTRHMTAVSAVVLGTTFMPLLGLPEVHELRAFQDAVEGFSDARAHAIAPRRDDEAARERSSRSTLPERTEPDRGVTERAELTDDLLTVERPERASVEMIEVLPPLPPIEGDVRATDLMAPIEAEAIAPEPAEPQAEPPPAEAEPEEEPIEEKEPAVDGEER